MGGRKENCGGSHFEVSICTPGSIPQNLIPTYSCGNLATVLAHKAALATPPVSLILQSLVVPVVDTAVSHTDSVYPSWSKNIKTCGLVPGRILWFRNLYLPDETDRTRQDYSPTFSPDEAFQRTPNAWIGVCEGDILRDECVFCGEKLRKSGKKSRSCGLPTCSTRDLGNG